MTELEYWTDQIKKSRISRREFMGRAAALGVTTALATTMLSQAGIGAEPKKGGSAKFGLPHGATTDTMDPGNGIWRRPWNPATTPRSGFSSCASLAAPEREVDAFDDLVPRAGARERRQVDVLGVVGYKK